MRNFLSALQKSFAAQILVWVMLAPGLILLPLPLDANPNGANVVKGNVNFKGLGSASLDINNASNRAIINWQSFSIQQGEVTRINQAGNAVTLNRVVAGNPSQIYGMLKASRGGVVLINPNGITVGPGGTVDVAGLLTMSTLDIADNDFLNGGSNRFRGTTGAGIVNYGSISSENGDLTLLGNFLQNAGTVSAPDGNVLFGAGGDIIVNQTVGGGTISVLAGGAGGGVGIENSGEINAASAELKASGNVYALAIKNDGVVRANGYKFSGGKLTLSGGSRGSVVNTGQLVARNTDGSGGRVSIHGRRVEVAEGKIDAAGVDGKVGGSVSVSGRKVIISDTAAIDVGGSDGGSVRISGSTLATNDGSIDASGSVGNGGSVDISGDSVVLGTSSSIDVSGYAEGGSARVGGGLQGEAPDIANSRDTTVQSGSVIRADSDAGNAGNVVIWSDGDTMFEGTISAQALGNVGNGGFVEVSGLHNLFYFATSVSTASANGRTGQLLLDPTNVIVGPGGTATISDTALVDAVLANNVVIHTASGGTDPGDITILPGSNIVYDSPNSLAFFAHGSIYVNGDIKNHGTTDTAFSGTGNITLVAGWDGVGAGAFSFDPTASGGGASGPVVTAQDVVLGNYGEWGLNNGSVYLNDSALEPVEVGSARGETNAFGSNVEIRGGDGGGEFTQLGYRRENDTRGTARTSTGTINTASDIDYETGVTGNINLHARQDVILAPNSNTSPTEGIKSTDRVYVMVGHGGQRDNNDDVDNRGGTDYGSDSGNLTVGDGDNHGDITITAGRALLMTAARNEAPVQIGHGGRSGSAVNSNTGDTVYTANAINGDLSGDITVAAGLVDVEAGFYNQSYALIGHGGMRARGDYSGDVSVTTTIGGILAEAAPDSAIGGPTNSNDWRWRNNRDQSFVQFGHGGFDSDNINSIILPQRTVTLNTNDGAADVVTGSSVAGDGIQINPETGQAYGHSGDISVISARGIEFRAANGTDAYAMIGHGGRSTSGDHRGDIQVEAQNGSIIFDRDADQVNERGRDITNRGQRAHVQIGHGGTRYVGGATGDIDVRATGNIEFYAGRSESYAMVGHGGRGETGSTWNGGRQRNNQANGTHSGNITVVAGGDIVFRSGFGPTASQAYSQIGHGGYFQLADVIDVGQGGVNGPLIGGGAISADQEGHNGDISVTAGGSISFKAGADTLREGQTYFEANARDSWTQIGHGGYFSKGDHHGRIAVTAAEDMEFEARGGWDTVTIENNGSNSDDTTGEPRLNQTEDNGRNGYRNYAMIGHGGVDSTHNDNNATQNWNNSGKEGDGLGNDYGDGESDITIDVGGDFTMKGAMEETAGAVLPIRMFEDNGAGNPNIGAVENTYTLRDPLFVGSASGLTDTVLITADNYNDGPTDVVILEGDGTTDLSTLVANWNTANPDNTITLHSSSDGSQVLAGGAVIAVTPYASFSGEASIIGAQDPNVILRAEQITSDQIVLTGDGSTELLTLVDDWNTANPDNMVDIEFGDISMILEDGATVTLDGGIGARPSAGDPRYSQHYGRLKYVVRDNGEVWELPEPVFSAEDGFAKIGNGGRSDDYRGGVDGAGHRGQITIDVGGDMTFMAGDMQQSVGSNQALTIQVRNFQSQDGTGSGTVGGDGQYLVGPALGSDTALAINNDNNQNDPTVGQRNFAHIGLGGWGSRGDHLGDISLEVGGFLDLIAGEGRESYAQIGNGGYEADGYTPNGNLNDNNDRAGDTGHRGNITVTVGDTVRVLGGGRDGDVIGALGTDPSSTGTLSDNNNARATYAQIGHGGYADSGNHTGDIGLQAGSDIHIQAGTNPRGAYAQVGHGGYGARSESFTGDILVYSESGDISLIAGTSIADTQTAMNGLDNTGHIASGRWNYAQIGHGGLDSDAQSGSGLNNGPGSGGNSGNIDVVAKRGNVFIEGGGNGELTANNNRFDGMYSMVGHGGYATDGDMTGDIEVTSGESIVLTGGESYRDPYSQVGHGGYASSGNHSGTIDLDAGANVILTRGIGNFNPWAKVGHGAQAYGGRNNNGTGSRSGDIFISAGFHFSSAGGLVGHVDPLNVGDLFASGPGDTFIAVSRSNPFAGGPGNLITDPATVLASGGFGISGELRLYMPDPAANQIAAGTYLNSVEYSRVPTPDGTRGDEQFAVEHTFGTGTYGEIEGVFTPEGAYPTNGFGLYNLYYAGESPETDITDPVDVVLPPVDLGFDFLPFLFGDQYDAFIRQEALLFYDGYDGQLYSIALDDALVDNSDPSTGGWFLENLLDSNLGDTRNGNIGNDREIISNEREEELLWRKEAAQRKVGKASLTFYVYNPGTNEYSSYRLFGVPKTLLPAAQ